MYMEKLVVDPCVFYKQFYPKEFDIEKIGTHDQRADYLTKALPRLAFENNRKHVQGW